MAFNYNKFRSFCRVFRMILGTGLIGYGVYSGNAWFYLGVLPLVAGILNFCPTCLISKKCDLPEAKA
jgi:hypothetical protein